MLMKEIWSLGEKPFPSMTPLEVSCVCVHAANMYVALWHMSGNAVSAHV